MSFFVGHPVNVTVRMIVVHIVSVREVEEVRSLQDSASGDLSDKIPYMQYKTCVMLKRIKAT